MKKLNSQIAVALVCALLGFLLSYQFKLLSNKQQSDVNTVDKSDILAELDALKKEKEELVKKNESLSSNLKNLETAATNKGDINQEIKNELDKTRMMLGTEDVKGSGIILYVNPKSNILTPNNNAALGEDEVVHLVNVLFNSGAEAVSVNDHRVTPQTGIKVGNNKIWIGINESIYVNDKLVFKAIGDKTNLRAGLSFPGVMQYYALGTSYNYEIKESDDLLIKKSTQVLTSDFIKPVK